MLTKKIVICLMILCGSQAFGSAAPKAKEEGHTKTPAEVQQDARDSLAITNDYVHKWMPFIAFSGASVFNDEPVKYTPKKGTSAVIYFIASWCLPCQRLLPKMQAIHKLYKAIHTDFYYIFAHDTKDDAKGFAKEYGITENALIADHKILQDFHNPKLPTVYVSDRRQYLLQRFIDVSETGLSELNETLAKMTAF